MDTNTWMTMSLLLVMSALLGSGCWLLTYIVALP
jgi:hypothetical protein